MKKSIAKIATYGILGTSLAVTPVMAFALTGCSSNQSVVESGDSEASDTKSGKSQDVKDMGQVSVKSSGEAGDIFEGIVTNDAVAYSTDYGSAKTITVSDSSANVEISEPGTYVVTGKCGDGNIKVSKGVKDVVLVLKDLDISSTSSAPVSVGKDSVVKLIVSGDVKLTDSENASDESSSDTAVVDAFDGAAIKIKAGSAVCLCGDGTLIINGSTKNGISCSDDSTFVVDDDKLTVDITATNDGVNSNYDVALLAGKFSVTAGDDGLHANRVLTLGKQDTSLEVSVKNSVEGLEAAVVNVCGGNVSVTASEDGINISDSDGVYSKDVGLAYNQTGGSVSVTSGMDGLDSNGDINLVSGSFIVEKSANQGGDGGLDYDGNLYVADDFSLTNEFGTVDFGSGANGGNMKGRGNMSEPSEDFDGNMENMPEPPEGFDKNNRPSRPDKDMNQNKDTAAQTS